MLLRLVTMLFFFLNSYQNFINLSRKVSVHLKKYFLSDLGLLQNLIMYMTLGSAIPLGCIIRRVLKH